MNSYNERSLALDEKRMRRQSKNYEHRPARVFIEVAKKPLDVPEAITDPAQIRAAVEGYVFDESKVRFCASSRAHKIAHLEAHSIDPSFGLLFRDIKLSELRAILGRGLECDEDILKILDELSASHKIKITFASIPDGAKGYNDILFIAQIGVATMEIARPSTIMALTFIVWHKDQPLTKAEFESGNKPIVPSIAASSMRAKRDAHFRASRGWSNFIESRLHREDLEDEARLKSAIIKLAEGKGEKPAADEDKQ